MNWQRIRMGLAIVGLLALSVSGFWGVDQEWRWATTLGLRISTALQILYSVLGLLAVPTLWLKHRWRRALLYAWALSMVLTGATAPALWAHQGWMPTLFAAAVTAVCAAVVIALAPLPPASEGFKRWRGAVFVVAILASALVLYLALGYTPLVLGGRRMESFCEGLRKDMSHGELKAVVEAEGYRSSDQTDKKGPYLRIDADSSGGHYHCEVRFKPDGSIGYISFTAQAKD